MTLPHTATNRLDATIFRQNLTIYCGVGAAARPKVATFMWMPQRFLGPVGIKLYEPCSRVPCRSSARPAPLNHPEGDARSFDPFRRAGRGVVSKVQDRPPSTILRPLFRRPAGAQDGDSVGRLGMRSAFTQLATHALWARPRDKGRIPVFPTRGRDGSGPGAALMLRYGMNHSGVDVSPGRLSPRPAAA